MTLTKQARTIKVKDMSKELVSSKLTKHRTDQSKDWQVLKAPSADLINSLDKSGLTPLQLAVKNQDIEAVILLLEHGADPNQTSPTEDAPLIIAIRENNPNIVLKLLEEGASVNVVDRQEQSVLKIATNIKADKCLDLLLEYGAHFSSAPRSVKLSNNHQTPQDFIDKMIYLLIEVANHHKPSQGFKKFYQYFAENLQLLFVHYKKLDISPIKAELMTIFEQIMYPQPIEKNSTCLKKQAFNLLRRTLKLLSKVIKINDDEQGNQSLCILSKMDYIVENRLVSSNEENQQPSTYNTPNITATINIDYNNLTTLNTKQIVTRTADNNMMLLEFVSITPKPLNSKELLEYFIAISEKRLQYETNFHTPQTLNPTKAKLLQLSSTDTLSLDKLLRPGISTQTHILVLDRSAHKNLDVLKKLACITGSTVHTVQYPPNITDRTDLIYIGISTINTLLDLDVHPDKVFIQSSDQDRDIIVQTLLQFQNQGVNFSEIVLTSSQNADYYQKNTPRCFMLNYQACNTKNDLEFNDNNFHKFNKYVAETLTQHINDITLSSVFETNYDTMQLISLFITVNQLVLKNNPSWKNPAFPMEKVDTIMDYSFIRTEV